MCEVVVLFNGYSEILNDSTMRANCTCTLVKGEKNIIVDTMTAWDRDNIIEALARNNLAPPDIDYVVCTHSHSDHIGNNNLFTNAEHIVGHCVQRGNLFYEKNLKNEEYQLCEGVKIVPTPGHTAEDVTVMVESKSSLKQDEMTMFAITGDLFEKEEDIFDAEIWKNLGTKELQLIQSKMRDLIINKADFIIPGHGPMFSVTSEMKQLVRNQGNIYDPKTFKTVKFHRNLSLLEVCPKPP